ncbi:PREDICTED: thiosulfate sulfurtransferase/rhodanese-like domain-containing protein 3 isoform X2 [Cercocebus atys]|uniref:thiosulfate sulfurtransferase/rhodanese-like domain-containing protein 3 isoform X2 n=1 Tax=Cercocebus atys TaxID=9531 RepID=UPI0005F500BB|nr:PREDICTED: thiosulfate sulfurtransferase/rhodanese-like domain-containing protein 3 isoform X2 [Cercocebus atys]
MVPPWLLLGTERRAVLGSAKAALCVDEVGEALQMNPRDFKEKYNEVKPSKSDHLVFSCLAGVRRQAALDTAVSLGFHRSREIPQPAIFKLEIQKSQLCISSSSPRT